MINLFVLTDAFEKQTKNLLVRFNTNAVTLCMALMFVVPTASAETVYFIGSNVQIAEGGLTYVNDAGESVKFCNRDRDVDVRAITNSRVWAADTFKFNLCLESNNPDVVIGTGAQADALLRVNNSNVAGNCTTSKVSIPAGSSEYDRIKVRIKHDFRAESDEVLTLRFADTENLTPGNTKQITILDDDNSHYIGQRQSGSISGCRF